MFERIVRRQAERPDEDDGQATADLPVDDRPTERMDAVAPPSDGGTSEQPAEPPTTPPPPAIDLTARIQADEAAAAPPTPADAEPNAAQPEPAAPEPAPRRAGFRARGRMRRRLRYLRTLRELQVRDLGGLVFDLRRFERKRDDLLAQKIDQIRACDDELHALEQALEERRELRDVREPGIGGTCPRCFAIYGSADKFCANCGAAFGGAVQGPAAQVPLAPSTQPSTQPAATPPASTPEASGPGRPGSQA